MVEIPTRVGISMVEIPTRVGISEAKYQSFTMEIQGNTILHNAKECIFLKAPYVFQLKGACISDGLLAFPGGNTNEPSVMPSSKI